MPDNFHPLAVFVAEDIAYKSGLLFSPNFLRDDGNCWEVMDELVDCGIDGFNPIEVSAGMSVEKLRKRYPNLVLCGRIDASELMVHGTPKEVFEATKNNSSCTKRLPC